MKNYQFRTNWCGKLILQRLHWYRDQHGDKNYVWEDATTTDLKDYYEQLCKVQTLHTCEEQRGLFDAQCG